ncbi:hypothetical protein BJ875DRAFT_521667 [Amylocarpus encephaloides]|uniref:Uncharacterized protein n=1 Tax=Amylocarpus encephaloides TaxID=45428 RepID=A0A9P7YAV9_9HELO|nr:hypothetical protein BJ875DRAFT_521667 [Amylocarpus encephaloides]
MTGSQRVSLSCWVSLDEHDRLCKVSLDRSTVEEVSRPSEQQVDSTFQAWSYAGMAALSSSRAKKGTSRKRRRSRHSSQKVDSLRLSDDLSQSATASQGPSSQGPSSPEGVPSTPESAIPEEHSPQLNDNMAIVDSHLPARSPVCTMEEKAQRASQAPETSPTYERACPTVSADELATPSEPITGPSSSFIVGSSHEADTERQGFDQACLPAAYTRPVSTADPTDSTFGPKAELKELYLEMDAIPIMSGILQTCVKYYEKTADFQNGDFLVTKVRKGIGATMKSPIDLTACFNVIGRDRIKRQLKKEQAGLETPHAVNLWKETFRYDYLLKIAEADTRAWSRDNPRPPANASQSEAEAVKELVDVVSKGRSPENYRKHYRFWKFLHDIRVEGGSTEMEDAEARILKDGLIPIVFFRTESFNRRFFNKPRTRARQSGSGIKCTTPT